MHETYNSNQYVQQASGFRNFGFGREPGSLAVCADGGLAHEVGVDRIERMPQEVPNT